MKKVFAIILALMMTAGCFTAFADGLSVDSLTATYVTSPLNVPSIVEKENGIFTETLGIPVEYAEITSGADQTQALASGDVQLLYAVGGTSIILSAANGADIKVLNIELKSPRANETSIVKDTIDMVKEFGLFDRLLISSFDPKLIAEAKQIDPNTKTGFLVSPNSKVTFRVFRNPLEVAKALNADALHPFSMYITEDLVKRTHEAGLQLNAWTINAPRSVDKMIEFGVDGIITNFPDVINGLLEKHGLPSAKANV